MPLTVSQAINNILIIRDHYARQQLAEDHAQKTIEDAAQAKLHQDQIDNIEEKPNTKQNNPSQDTADKEETLKEQKKALKALEKRKLKPQKSTSRHKARLAVLDDLTLEAINISRSTVLAKVKLERALESAIRTIRESAFGSSGMFGKGSKVAGSLEEVLHALNPLNTYLSNSPTKNLNYNLDLGLRRTEEGTLQYTNIHIVNHAKEILGKYGETMDGRHHFWNVKVTRSEKVTAYQNMIGRFNVILNEVKEKNGIVEYDVKAELLKIITEQTSEQRAGIKEINEGKFSRRLDELQKFLERITSLGDAPTRDEWLADKLTIGRAPSRTSTASGGEAATDIIGNTGAVEDVTSTTNVLDLTMGADESQSPPAAQAAGIGAPSGPS